MLEGYLSKAGMILSKAGVEPMKPGKNTTAMLQIR